MKPDEIDLYSIIERLLLQWKLIAILNAIVIVIAISYLNMFESSYQTKIKFEINPSLNSEVSFQIMSSLKEYAGVEPDDFEDKYMGSIYNYKNFLAINESIFDYSDDEIYSFYNNLTIDKDRLNNKFIVYSSNYSSPLNNELILKLHSNANSQVQDWVINILKDLKRSFEIELDIKEEVHNLLIDREILISELKLEKQIISYSYSIDMALEELNAAKDVALNLGYSEPANDELYTIFNSRNLNVPVRFKVDSAESDYSLAPYSLANIAGIPLFLFGTKLIDSEIMKLSTEKDNIDNIFPDLRAEIKLLENRKSLLFVNEIDKELRAIKSLDSVIMKLEKFIEDTDYNFIYANENKILSSSEYTNLMMCLIIIFISFIISIIFALYNSERISRNKI